MSTPPNKRDARRAERLSNLANAQSGRAPAGQDAPADDAAPSDAASATPAAETVAPASTPANAGNTSGTSAARSATPSRPVSGTPSRPLTGTPARPASGTRPPSATARAGSGAARSATPSRPLTGIPARPASASAKPGVVKAATGPADVVTKRELRREDRRADIARVREERQRALQAAKRRQFLGRAAAIAAGVLVVALIGYFLYAASGTTAASGAVKTNGGTITCDTSEQLVTHYHANVQIYINGKNYPVPADVGIKTDSSGNSCLYWIHTHDTSGTIHIEAPQGKGPFTVGDLFNVWAKANPATSTLPGTPVLSSSSFFGMPVDAQHTLTVYIDGKATTGDPTKIQLKSQENIWLEYGAPLVPPTPFDFTANGVNP